MRDGDDAMGSLGFGRLPHSHSHPPGGGGGGGMRLGGFHGSLHQNLLQKVHSPTPKKPKKIKNPYRKFISRCFKLAARRGVGMLVLGVAAVVVFVSVVCSMYKDSVVPEGAELYSDGVASGKTELYHRSALHLLNDKSNSMSLGIQKAAQIVKSHYKKITQDGTEDHGSTLENFMLALGENRLQSPPHGHPCKSFAFPPPPADRKRTGPRACPVCYLPVEQALVQMSNVPSKSPILQTLTYIYEANPVRTESFGGSDFGGYPSLQQRDASFEIEDSMNVHCGFVRGRKPGRQTGFDIDETNLLEMEKCRGIVVASAIFGNYDIIQQPKNMSEAAKKNVCFYMFVDEETGNYIYNSSALDDRSKVGLWRVIVVRNLPYVDARRNGKVPKLLLHRLFPNARYSIWIDGKLELVVDPYQILERFLWRNGATFAISRHYSRYDVFKEAEANKAAGKYENASIDFQVDFYKNEGLTPYTRAKLPIPSDVPEGCVIIKEHIPITNLFTCLWFNEVDRFTSRDQLSFSMVRDKIMSKVDWSINMFLDCERRNFVVQTYHKDLLEHMPPPAVRPPVLTKTQLEINRTPARKPPPRRGRERRSRRHRKTAAGSRDMNPFDF